MPTVFEGSDRVLVNLETALTERDTPIPKIGPNLKASPVCAEVLKEIGVTDCSLCNNHIFDYGIQGVRDTMEKLNEIGMLYTGFGENYEDSRRNLVMKKDGKTVAIIAV